MAADRAAAALTAPVDSEPASAEPAEAETPLDPALIAIATAAGESWMNECVRELRAQDRLIAGGWPGTLREARRRLLAATRDRALEARQLDELSRIANLAARRGWETVSEPDLEP